MNTSQHEIHAQHINYAMDVISPQLNTEENNRENREQLIKTSY